MNGDLKVLRIGVSESVNRCSVNVKGSVDVGNGFAFQNKPTCQLFLIYAQFSRASESHSSFLGSFSSCTCSLSDQVSLKLRYAGENCHDHFASVGCGISPRLRKRLNLCASLTDGFHRFQ